MAEARSAAQRKEDALSLLGSVPLDAWVASASSDGRAHLVPLSAAWDGERVILATERDAVTTRNITSAGRARLAMGETRDVLMMEASLEAIVDVEEASEDVTKAWRAQSDWDPRGGGGRYVFLILRAERVQAWREANEIAGRTLMRDGRWLI